ncbi:MAG: tRNA (guanine37-N1)-methyltransferase [Gammaproteobacteria bacterium]
MRIDVITLFPEQVSQVIEYGVVGRAANRSLMELKCWNPRDFCTDKHRAVDDRPYGGGPGMLMKIQPLRDAITAVRKENSKGLLVYLSPQGRKVTQTLMASSLEQQSLILLCGRYEGIDERLVEELVDEEWSIGDYVLSGGELAAMVCIDAITRLIPGALGHELSAEQDSFNDGLLDCPHYTRPEELHGRRVPEVLMNGNHKQIQDWRDMQSLGRTWLRRPDLLETRQLDTRQQKLLENFKTELEAARKR